MFHDALVSFAERRVIFMAKSNNTLCLDKFYPEKDLMITDIDQQSDKIIIQMKSTSSSCKCPKCNRIT